MRRMSRRTITKKLKQALKHEATGKAAYEKAHDLIEQVGKAGVLQPGELVQVHDGLAAEIVDQFENETIVWAHAAARRYKLKTTKIALEKSA